MEEQKYYIVSRKHMHKNEQIFILWGPDFCGYTTNVAKAGKYTKEEVQAHYDCSQDFPIIENYVWHIGKKIGNFLIPADDEEALKKIGLQKVTVITYR